MDVKTLDFTSLSLFSRQFFFLVVTQLCERRQEPIT